MEILKTKGKVKAVVQSWKSKGYTIGLVPTMGALHEGHLQLVRRSLIENDKTICSIFVNPLQFNKKEDLDKYPDTFEQDLQFLEKEGCDIVFAPEAEAFYEGVGANYYDFGLLGTVMEAQHRPGHFEGVAAVVKELFLAIMPQKAYFGEKDFQQLSIIKWLRTTEQFPIEIVGCDTVRSGRGLALSSRNLRLTEKALLTAAEIYATLNFCRNNVVIFDPQTLVEHAIAKLNQNCEVEYFEIVDEETFERVEEWEETTCPRAFVVVHLEGVRLIDNLSLNP